jgi:hypothetical protein
MARLLVAIDNALKAVYRDFASADASYDAYGALPSGAGALPSLPPALQELVTILYCGRFGVLFGGALQHSDDVCFLRSLLLVLGRADALRLLAPALLSFDAHGALATLPLSTLALQSRRILLLDHQTHVILWSGRAVLDAQFDAFRAALLQRARKQSLWRIPCPRVTITVDGSSSARWIMARMQPQHQDSAEAQIAAFPELAALSAEEMQEMRARLLPTEQPTFTQYVQQLLA